MKRIEHLDGLRGLAALAVTLSHFESLVNTVPTGAYEGRTLLHSLYTHVANGTFGVMIFFVLSGYVLLAGHGSNGRSAFAFGAVKRYFRLMPPILAALLLATVLGNTVGLFHVEAAQLIGGHPWLENVSPQHLTFTEAIYQGLFGAFVGQHGYIGALWTMKVEFFGSLMLFAVAAIAYQQSWYAAVAGVIAVLLILLGGDVGLYLSLFFVGSIFLRYQFSLPIWLLPVGLMLGLAKHYDIASQLLALPLPWLEEGAASAAILLNAIGAAIVLLTLTRPSPLTVALASRPMVWLGRVSFSLYLCHLPVMQSFGLLTLVVAAPTIGVGPAAGLAFMVSVAVSLAVAELLTRLADIPAQRMANWLARRILAIGKQPQPARA